MYVLRCYLQNNCCVCLVFQDFCNLLLVGYCGYILSVLFKLQKRPQNNAARLNAQTSRSTHVNCMLHSLPCLLSRGSVLTVFVLRSSSFHAFYTFTLLPSSSILLHTPESSAYHPSALSPVVNTLFLTMLSLNQLSVILLFLLQLQHIEDYDTLWR